MKKLLLLFSIFAFCNLHFAFSQNLVPNYSFEDTVACPIGLNQVENAVGWKNFRGTPDYFNSCATPLSHVSVPSNPNGYQCPANGNAYVGILVYGPWGTSSYKREFLGTQLTNPLVIGQRYYVSFKVNLADESLNACNNLGALFSTFEWPVDTFSTAPLKNFAHLYTNQIITDTLVWITISGSFVADSNYKYIIIGNHWDDTNTDTLNFFETPCCNPYYLFDDICVSSDSLTCIIADGYNVCDTGTEDIEYSFNNKIKIYPTLTKDKIIIENNQGTMTYYSVFNMVGKEIKSWEGILDSRTDIELKEFTNGMYIIHVWTNQESLNQKIILFK